MMKAALTAAVMTLGASPMFAADTQPYDPVVKHFAYEKNVENFCPAGTQPIRYNGVVCCGVPNATGYGDAPVSQRRYVPAMATNTTDPKSPNYVPERISMGSGS
ncbi:MULTISPECIES: hypothetical protein [Roseobacteraceae]|uniref:hypothetical protein n=1 Tax=Roseobacteraceae TaxID=2854170 RepID=UPI00125EB835|nr:MULTISPECIES: hypothetical protein [Roseobacteraceae]|tara:strand:- start:2225 stop:2536 length:312 start_codon:yes stop_codon:yes gene_type:complete